MVTVSMWRSYFFFNDSATTEIYTLSLHDALPISRGSRRSSARGSRRRPAASARASSSRSEEHTSELQSRQYLVCRLLLEKKKNYISAIISQAPSPPIVKTIVYPLPTSRPSRLDST